MFRRDNSFTPGSKLMYDPNLLPPTTLKWVMDKAKNELHAYLCEVVPCDENIEDWSVMVRATAAQCRIVAAASTDLTQMQSWLDLASYYEGTIEQVP
jgi:hypothetical protein